MLHGKQVKLSKNHMPYRVFVLLNNARLPKDYTPRKTLRAARVYLQGVSRHTIFVDGHIERFDAKQGKWVFVEGHQW